MFFVTKSWIKEVFVGIKNGKTMSYNVYTCPHPHCNKQSAIQHNYCPNCGRKLKKAK